MGDFFRRNLDWRGRLFRGVIAIVLLAAGVYLFPSLWWAGTLLLAGAAFALFEALRGWCLMRACGVKTRL
jgi:hypothetical protein